MPVNSVEISHVHNSMSNNWLLLANNALFAVMLACPMIPGVSRYFANTYLCLGIILLLAFLNYRLNKKAIASIKAGSCGFASEFWNWKLRARVVVWAALISAVIFIGIGPVLDSQAYAEDKFTRIIGRGDIRGYFVTKKVHYFYFAVIIYGLLLFNIYRNICLSLVNNLNNKVRRLGEFTDTLLFVGYSFLAVCVYIQFSKEYGSDLTVCLIKLFLIFSTPAFYLWQTGRLKVHDIRMVMVLALFSLVLSVNICLYFDTGNFSRYSYILAVVLFLSAFFFVVTKMFGIFDTKVLYSKLTVISLIGAISVVFFSLAFEFSNILALKTGRFIDVEKIFHWVFYSACWLSLGWLCCARQIMGRKAYGAALFFFVLGVALIQFQPPLIISSNFSINENANYAVPISDFLNFGKLPWFENFPGHGLSWILSSLVYYGLTSDYYGALAGPWYHWIFNAACIAVVYSFFKKLSNGLCAVSLAVLLPYIINSISFYGICLAVILPFILYVKTFKKRYLIATALISIFLVAYRLDIGFAFLAGIICSSFCVGVYYRKPIIYRVLSYLGFFGAAVIVLLLLTCLAKGINSLSRIHEFLLLASSNEHWGHFGNGDTEKILYPIVYFVVPVLSVVCLLVTITFRARLSRVHAAVLFCLIFAYLANIPRILVIYNFVFYWHSLLALWVYTIPIALSFLLAGLFSRRSLFVLFLTVFVLVVNLFYQSNLIYESSPFQNAIGRTSGLSAEVVPDIRKRDIGFVFNRGSRVQYDDASAVQLFHANEVKAVADLLLAPNETFLDFTNQSAAYALSRRENLAYTVQPPSVLSGEQSQRLFIGEFESKIQNVPIAIMPANVNWYYVLNYGGMSNNLRHYLVAEWIYNNYRPLFKYNDFASVWVLNSRYDEFYNRLKSQRLLADRNDLLAMADLSRSINGQTPVCHNCVVNITPSGMQIKPTGPAPFLMDFDELIGAVGKRSFNYLTLYLSEDNNEDYKVHFLNSKVNDYSETYSVKGVNLLPKVKVFDFSRYSYDEQPRKMRLTVPEHGVTVIRNTSLSTTRLSKIASIDWGYDNFVSGPEALTYYAHEHNLELLPYVWGQFDVKKAAENADLTAVSFNDSLYSWEYSGHEHKPAYLRVDLSVSQDLLSRVGHSYLNLGSVEDGKFKAFNRYWFQLKEGSNTYLFRISSDYYWSRGKLNKLFIDPNIRDSVVSVRLLEGD